MDVDDNDGENYVTIMLVVIMSMIVLMLAGNSDGSDGSDLTYHQQTSLK